MITIAWDVDDVLNNLMFAWFMHKWLPEHPKCTLSYEDIISNPPHNLIGVSKEEYLISLDEFRFSSYLEIVKPNRLVYKWFSKYGDKAYHIALTSVPTMAANISAQWVFKYFGNYIRTFHFIPSYRTDGAEDIIYDGSKGEYIDRIGNIDVLVEDNYKNIESLKENTKGLLVSVPWNRKGYSMEKILNMLTNIIEDSND